ncbi:MAG: hypothetical protein ACFFAK_03585 [Promethearchaeota archaeon]
MNLYLIPLALIVCPALFPPLNLTTISDFWAKKSTNFPFPSYRVTCSLHR